jgi:hypothetical protein
MEAIHSSEISVLTRATRRHVSKDSILRDGPLIEFIKLQRSDVQYSNYTHCTWFVYFNLTVRSEDDCGEHCKGHPLKTKWSAQNMLQGKGECSVWLAMRREIIKTGKTRNKNYFFPHDNSSDILAISCINTTAFLSSVSLVEVQCTVSLLDREYKHIHKIIYFSIVVARLRLLTIQLRTGIHHWEMREEKLFYFYSYG